MRSHQSVGESSIGIQESASSLWIMTREPASRLCDRRTACDRIAPGSVAPVGKRWRGTLRTPGKSSAQARPASRLESRSSPSSEVSDDHEMRRVRLTGVVRSTSRPVLQDDGS